MASSLNLFSLSERAPEIRDINSLVQDWDIARYTRRSGTARNIGWHNKINRHNRRVTHAFNTAAGDTGELISILLIKRLAW